MADLRVEKDMPPYPHLDVLRYSVYMSMTLLLPNLDSAAMGDRCQK